jgi:hypothetical protein
MNAELLELLPELLELTVLGAGTVGLTIVGAFIEQFALATAQHGDVTIGAWAALIGTAALYLAFMLATDKLPDQFTVVRRALAE